MDRMRSIVLDTIRDIALILREFDPGGCTSACPEDEYVHEAIDVWMKMKDLKKNRPADIEILGWLIEQNMQKMFAGIAVKNVEMYEQIARACLNVRDVNRELHLKEKMCR